MSKTCPNCGVNSPDNAKFCIECAYSLEDVPINKEESVQKPKKTDNGIFGLNPLILIAIVVIVIAAAGFLIFGSGGNDNAGDNQTTMSIVIDKIVISDFDSSGTRYFDYDVYGFINNYPGDDKNYMVKTIYYDSSGNELTSTTNRLSSFKDSKDYDFSIVISSYYTEKYLDVDHVSVQIIKDNNVLKEFNSSAITNQLTDMPNNSSNISNTSK